MSFLKTNNKPNYTYLNMFNFKLHLEFIHVTIFFNFQIHIQHVQDVNFILNLYKLLSSSSSTFIYIYMFNFQPHFEFSCRKMKNNNDWIQRLEDVNCTDYGEFNQFGDEEY